MRPMLLTIATGQLLSWNQDGLILYSSDFFLIIWILISFLWKIFISCSFQEAEEDCTKAISLDKKVNGDHDFLAFYINGTTVTFVLALLCHVFPPLLRSLILRTRT